MSSVTLAPAAVSRPAVNPWFVATAVVVPAFMEILDTTIATASLRYIAGGLSATMNDSDWVMTSYLAANANRRRRGSRFPCRRAAGSWMSRETSGAEAASPLSMTWPKRRLRRAYGHHPIRAGSAGRRSRTMDITVADAAEGKFGLLLVAWSTDRHPDPQP